jgi:Tfp pilus assembly protein PilO
MRYYLRHKSLVAILVSAMVVLLGLGVFVYRVRAHTLGTLRVELDQKRTRLAGAQARIAKRGQLEKEYAELRTRLAVLEPSLPTYAYVPTFLKQIEALATNTHNAVAGVRPLPKPAAPAPNPPAAGEGEGSAANGAAKPAANSGAPGTQPKDKAKPTEQMYDRLPIEVSLTGGYWDTARFLHQLATFPKMIAVSDMQFTPTSGARGGITVAPDLQVKVNLMALIYKGGEEKPWTSDAKNSPS